MKIYKKTITMKNNKKRTYYYKKDANGVQTRINAETYKAYLDNKKRGGQIAIPNPRDPLFKKTLMADNSGPNLCFVYNPIFEQMYGEAPNVNDTVVNFYRNGFKLTEKKKTINGNVIEEACITNKKAIEQTLDDTNTYCSIFNKDKRKECKDALNNAFIISQQNKRILEFNNSCFSVNQLEALRTKKPEEQYASTVGIVRAKYFMHPKDPSGKENKDLICLKPEYTYKIDDNNEWWIININNEKKPVKLVKLCNIFPGLTANTCKAEIVVNKNPPKTTT